MRTHIFWVIGLLAFAASGFGQDKSTARFGNVTEKDFATHVYRIDSAASAVVIADIGSSIIEGNRNAWFSLVFKKYTRIHILNKNGYDAASISIPLYTSGIDEEKIDRLRAVTYNLENGKVVETKLDVKASVFSDKINKNLIVKKFTMPNVKEGSIIEIEYTLTSDFLNNFQSWEFQGSNPVLWSQYDVSLPDFLGYVFITQGYHNYDINEKKTRSEGFRVVDSRNSSGSEIYTFNAGVTDYHWVMKNVWALKEENFTSTLRNHIAKIEFQLSEYRQPLSPDNFMGSWEELAGRLLESEFFGKNITRENGFLKEMVRPVIEGSKSDLEKAKKIFSYVRNSYTSSDFGVYMDQNLKNVSKAKTGNVADLNILLTAMLIEAGIKANPVILSTRAHGFTFPLYPMLQKFNYTISQAIIDDKIYYLDASEPRMGFGFLPLRCYNGHARIITNECPGVELAADSILEKKSTGIFMVTNEKGELAGSVQQVPGYYESYSMRNMIKEKGQTGVETDIRKGLGVDASIKNLRIDSLDQYESNLNMKYDFIVSDTKEDILYINPMFGEAYKENPFKSTERFYPVEMPFTIDETYILHLEVPAGYVVDELPKPISVKLNEAGEGSFEYRIAQSGQTISLRSRVRLSRAYFTPEEYEMLREFYNLIVAKHAEQIVLKKQK